MEQQKMLDLINRLYDKTISEELKWEETGKENSFQVSFSNFTLRINDERVLFMLGRPLGTRGGYLLDIHNWQGNLIETINSSDFEGSNIEEKMKTIYEEARRQVMNVDKAIDELLEELK